MHSFSPRPLLVSCDSCGKTGETWDGEHPDLAVICECCPIAHDHAGLGCRTVTITAFAHLTILNAGDLLAIMEMREQEFAREVINSLPGD